MKIFAGKVSAGGRLVASFERAAGRVKSGWKSVAFIGALVVIMEIEELVSLLFSNSE